MSSGFGSSSNMQRMTDAGSDHLSLKSVFVLIEYLHYLSNKLHAIMADIIEPAYK